jgi:CDP-glucose 4,6-dehydratase
VCVLQAIRAASKRSAVVNVTTDKCYKNQEWSWGYRENDELGGRDPYANSKACAELVSDCFRESFFRPADLAKHGISLATARAGNVIGGGDWTRDQLVPDMIRAFISHKPVQIRYPNATRPWQHVIDCLAGYMTLAEKLSTSSPRYCAAWNFGPRAADVKPVAWIADFFTSAWGGDASWSVDTGAHPHEASMLRLDSSNATELLGWEPALDLRRALDWTSQWYRLQHSGESARELCLRQLTEYEAGLDRRAMSRDDEP